ncbi:MAG: hypothetical protein MZW92_08390 [Comamonadaceae bacterium]|nr:hypothetical protein [Comamonadaceae bacterium]
MMVEADLRRNAAGVSFLSAWPGLWSPASRASPGLHVRRTCPARRGP